MNSRLLKNYILEYGGIRFLKDLSNVFSALGEEWFEHGDKELGHIFSDASISIANISNKFESAEKKYLQSQEPSGNELAKLQLEYDQIVLFFKEHSAKQLSKIWSKDRKSITDKLKRLYHLQNEIKKRKD